MTDVFWFLVFAVSAFWLFKTLFYQAGLAGLKKEEERARRKLPALFLRPPAWAEKRAGLMLRLYGPEVLGALEALGVDPNVFAALHLTAAAGAAAAAFGFSRAGLAVPGLLLFALAFFGPQRAAGYWYKKRQGTILADFPVFIDLLAIYLGAGPASVRQAVKAVTPRFGGPLREELDRLNVLGEQADFRAALARFGERTGLPEVRRFIAALIQADERGELLEVFEAQAASIRAIKKHTETARTKMLPVLMSFPPALTLVAVLLLFVIPFTYSLATKMLPLTGN